MDDFEFATKSMPNGFVRMVYSHPVIALVASAVVGWIIGYAIS